MHFSKTIHALVIAIAISLPLAKVAVSGASLNSPTQEDSTVLISAQKQAPTLQTSAHNEAWKKEDDAVPLIVVSAIIVLAGAILYIQEVRSRISQGE